jgi:hypothetical protein
VVDESATGFLVEADRIVPAQRDDVVTLRSQSGCFEVRIAHITRRAGRTRIGVQRLRDLFDADESPEHRPQPVRARQKVDEKPQRSMVAAGGAILGFSVVLVLGMVLLPGYLRGNVQLDRPNGSCSTGRAQPVSGEIHDDETRPYTKESLVSREQRKLLAARRRLLRRFASTDELGAAFGLTARQRQEIRHLVQTKLPPHPSESGLNPIDETVVNQVYAELAAMLTPEQRKRFFALRLQ